MKALHLHILYSLALLVSITLSATNAFAQKEKTSNIYIHVVDKVSNRQLSQAHVSVLTQDSTLISTCHVGYSGGSTGGREIFYACEVKSSHPYYLIKFECKGYKTRIIRAEATTEIKLNEVALEREVALRNLNEAVVNATKIKMVMKGDTIVYNADAFELSEGSMLDQLIGQLPGVKIERGGVITINGNKVSSMLINGKDLFNGDVQKAMENLPAYIVSKVKAYQKAPDDAYLTRQDKSAQINDPWVIDVNLKKDYNQGWIANAEASGGTDNRFLSRLFGMRFTDRTELFVYGSANNLNDKTQPWGDGRWYKNVVQNGQMSIQKAGANFAYNGRNNKNRISTSVNITHSTNNIDNRSVKTNYYETNDTYGRSHFLNHATICSTEWLADGKYAGKNAFLTWYHSLTLGNTHTHSDNQNITLYQQITETYPTAVLDSIFTLKGYVQPFQLPLINYYRDLSREQTKNWHLYEMLNLSLSKWTFNLQGDYNKTEQHLFSQYLLHSPQTSTTDDFRNRYTTKPQNNYSLYASITRNLFRKEKGNWSNDMNTSYTISYARNENSSVLYRLDKWNNGWNTPDGKQLGLLPSTYDSLSVCTDWANSFMTTTKDWHQQLRISYQLKHGKEFTFILSPELNYMHRNVNDWRNIQQLQIVRKNYAWVAPRLDISLYKFKLTAIVRHQLPNANYLLDAYNNSDPLFINKGNPALKAADTYSIRLQYNKFSRHTIVQTNLDYSQTHNGIGMARFYNTLTGVTTMQPTNINGNWQTEWMGDLAHELDKKERWELKSSVKLTYLHSNDLVQEAKTEVSISSMSLSTVRNFYTNASVGINYRSKPLNAGLQVQLDWQHATSQRANFTTLNNKDISSTFTLLAKLPWKVEIASDITLFSRRGYADHSMNSDEWIWNASIEKRLLKNSALSFKCSAVDLLAQRRNVERKVNAQGYTETWYNTIPRYLLFTLSYRFHKAPKRKY